MTPSVHPSLVSGIAAVEAYANRADLPDRMFPPPVGAGRPPSPGVHGRPGAVGADPRPARARGSLSVPVAVFVVSLLALRRWWR